MKTLPLLLIIVLTSLSGCKPAEKWENDIYSVDAGSGKAIRITEQVDRSAWPSGTYRSQLHLHYNDGNGWKTLDRSGKVTPAYSKMYSENDQFFQLNDPLVYYENLNGKELLAEINIEKQKERRFPTGSTWKRDYVWDIFISPEVVTAEDYRLISRLIKENKNPIQESIRELRPPREQGEDIGRYPTITSIVFRDYEKTAKWDGHHQTITYFTSTDTDLYITMTPPNRVRLFLPEFKEAAHTNGSVKRDRISILSVDIGHITDDQIYLLLWRASSDPGAVGVKESKIGTMVGDNWMEFYGSFTNKDGHNLYHYFEPISSDRRDENN